MKARSQARWVFVFLAVQFALPALSYLVQPELATATLDTVNRMLGGGAYVATEHRGHVWHMLAVGNVMTLAFMCALLAWNLARFGPVLWALAFLKGFSAVLSLGLALAGHPPLFYGVAVLDGVTVGAMLFFGMRGLRSLSTPPAPA